MRNQICQSCGLRPGIAQIIFFYAKYFTEEMALKLSLTEGGDSNLFQDPGNIRCFESYSELDFLKIMDFSEKKQRASFMNLQNMSISLIHLKMINLCP